MRTHSLAQWCPLYTVRVSATKSNNWPLAILRAFLRILLGPSKWKVRVLFFSFLKISTHILTVPRLLNRNCHLRVVCNGWMGSWAPTYWMHDEEVTDFWYRQNLWCPGMVFTHHRESQNPSADALARENWLGWLCSRGYIGRMVKMETTITSTFYSLYFTMLLPQRSRHCCLPAPWLLWRIRKGVLECRVS